MKEDHLSEDSRPKQEGMGKNVSDDLEFMRSAVEKAYRPVKPQAHVIIAWGLICVISYTAAYCFITPQGYMTPQVRKWILPAYLSLMAIGLFYTFVALFLAAKREKEAGFAPHMPKQITWVWFFVTAHVLAWGVSGMLSNNFSGGDPGFLGAMGLSIALCVTGIFHSRKWLIGAIVIFAGMLPTYFVRDYGYLILGSATGAGLIVPAIIVRRDYRKWEKENENSQAA
ncbi:MAG: hypothetical protein ACYSW0_01325 [Planctomycetota bacterium]|jgi:hypothetical protein